MTDIKASAGSSTNAKAGRSKREEEVAEESDGSFAEESEYMVEGGGEHIADAMSTLLQNEDGHNIVDVLTHIRDQMVAHNKYMSRLTKIIESKRS